MLSMMMITAITAVALPHLRFTTLSMTRSMAMAYALIAFVIALSCFNGVLSLFSESVVIDLLGSYLMMVMVLLAVGVLAHFTSQAVAISGTPYTLPVFIVTMIVGAYYLSSSNDVVTMAISLEIQSFALYALASLHRWREGSTAAGLMYFMLGAFSSGLVLLGVSMIYAYTGETVLTRIAPLGLFASTGYMSAALILLISGFLFKLASAPFHFWAPEVYDRVPTLMTVILTVLPKLSLLAMCTRLTPLLGSGTLINFLVYPVALSWAFGSVVGLVQSRIKRLMAYSTVSHVGWMLAALFVGSAIGIGGFLFYVAQYSVSSTMMFLALLALTGSGLIRGTAGVIDVELISGLNGLFSRSAIFTVVIAASLFSAAGIPPLVGFYAKLSVMQALLYGSSPMLVVLAVLSSVVSAGFYLSVISSMLFKVRST